MARYDIPFLTGEGVGIGTGLPAEGGATTSTYWLPKTASIMNHVHSLTNSWKCALSSCFVTTDKNSAEVSHGLNPFPPNVS